jgi:hypothetical protein
VQRARLRREHVAGRQRPDHQRAHAVAVAQADDSALVHHHDREAALELAHHAGDGVLQRQVAVARDEVDHDLAVVGGLEHRALASMRSRMSLALVKLPLCASAMRPLLERTVSGWALKRSDEPVVE